MEESIEGPEILSSFGSNISEEFHLDATSRNSADGDIEEDDRILRVWRSLVPFYHCVAIVSSSSTRHSLSRAEC